MPRGSLCTWAGAVCASNISWDYVPRGNSLYRRAVGAQETIAPRTPRALGEEVGTLITMAYLHRKSNVRLIHSGCLRYGMGRDERRHY